ncbi:MAG: alcohol dehydrogenase catalytic domain-containing protein [Caldilineaceae bacterium SB0662_bin_9]|uniref:Alcohol dehydrogenase catalytic domain-containing protein n=1 Tax=Caldilineaceae bacterium SB0662_bin_9 TaxID=2605258 RepID=A0A6B1DV87_9CHLR|nr:alcohol dehydrogenase catalytic domain-containing protein [Caldilineaceae bacterium]MYD90612.1 alcohol dehydrogenase catalytic domain-containing protein [Caldilineaceae bacterium SB0662_bin_9]
MHAAVLERFGEPLVWREMPEPVPESHEVVLVVRACGIDGTDLKLMDGFGYEPELPFVPGHEISGVVDSVGSAVTGLRPGMPAIVYNFETCGVCALCRVGRTQLCLDMGSVMGVLQAHGGMAEYVKVSARQVVPVSEALSSVDAATCCDAGLTAHHAIDRAGLKSGETVLVVGAGGVGSYVVQLVRRAGASPIVAELGMAKQAWARTMGATAVVDGAASSWTAALETIGVGGGVDCVLDIVGTRVTMQAGLEALRPGGRIVLVGYTPDDLQAAGKDLAQREIQILGTRAGTRRDLEAAAGLLTDGSLQSIVTRTFPMDEVNTALALLRSGKANGRIVLLAPGTAA